MKVYSKQEVEEMNEDEFVSEIILPILKGQGWQEIQNWHGRQELGKDVVGWRKNPEVGYLEALAVVAKATPTRKTSEIGAITTQITQALKRPFRTQTTQKELRVDHVWVVVNKPLAKETRDNIESGISFPHSKLVILDLDQCWELARPFILASKRDVLQLSQDTLRSFRSPYDLRLITSEQGQTLEVRERYAGQSEELPLKGRVIFTWDDPAKEQELIEYLRRIEETGEGERLPDGIRARVETEGIDEVALQLFGGLPEGASFEMGSAKSGEKLRLSLHVEPLNQDPVEIPFLEMRALARGSKQVRLTNDEQQLPIRVELLVKYGGETNFHFSVRIGEASSGWISKGMRLLRGIASRGTVTLTNVETGIAMHQMCIVIPQANSGWSSVFADVARVLATVEARTGQVIMIPNRSFSEEEVHTIEGLRLIVDEGHTTNDAETFRLTFSTSSDVVNELIDDVKQHAMQGHFRESGDELVKLFGTTINLGKWITIIPPAYLTNEEEIRAKVGEAEPGTNVPIEFKFRIAQGGLLRREYVEWQDGRILDQRIQG